MSKRRVDITAIEIVYWLMLLGMFVFAYSDRAHAVSVLVLITVLYSVHALTDKLGQCAVALERLADTNEASTREQALSNSRSKR